MPPWRCADASFTLDYALRLAPRPGAAAERGRDRRPARPRAVRAVRRPGRLQRRRDRRARWRSARC
ncbi:MAG: hypothetical protein MZW92_08430 [Comamonadaceae bacterium]|nr:hypothetical protein [Comamonadaceae bacterium]